MNLRRATYKNSHGARSNHWIPPALVSQARLITTYTSPQGQPATTSTQNPHLNSTISSKSKVLTIRKNPLSPLETVYFYILGVSRRASSASRFETKFRLSNPHLRVPKISQPGCSAHCPRNNSSRPDKPCTRCDMLFKPTMRFSDVCCGFCSLFFGR